MDGIVAVGHVAKAGADIDLAGALELEARVFQGFHPVGDPTGEAAEGEHYGEHVLGDAEGAIYDATVEVDVGVEVAGEEVVVVEGDFFEFHHCL